MRTAASTHADPEKTPESGDPAGLHPNLSVTSSTGHMICPPHWQTISPSVFRVTECWHCGVRECSRQQHGRAVPALPPQLLLHCWPMNGEGDGAAAGQGGLLGAGLHQVAPQHAHRPPPPCSSAAQRRWRPSHRRCARTCCALHSSSPVAIHRAVSAIHSAELACGPHAHRGRPYRNLQHAACTFRRL